MKARMRILSFGMAAALLFALAACKPSDTDVGDSSEPDTSSVESETAGFDSSSDSDDVGDPSAGGGSSAGASSGSAPSRSPIPVPASSTSASSKKSQVTEDDAKKEMERLNLKGGSITILTHLDPNGPDARLMKTRFKEYFNGNLVFDKQPYEKMGDRLMALVQSGKSPDIYAVRNWDFPGLMPKNVFESLDSHINFNSKIWAEDKGIYDQYMWNGKHYIIGSVNPSYYIWYNKNLMTEYGIKKDPAQLVKEGNWTWETFLELAKEMTDPSANLYGFVDSGASIVYAFMSGVDTDLIKLTNNGIESGVKSPQMAKALNFYSDLFNKHKVTYLARNAVQDFGNRKAAMLYDGSWLSASEPIKSMHDKGEVTFTHIPSAEKGKKPVYPAQVSGYAIPKGAKNINGAVAFLTLGQVTKPYAKQEREKYYETYKYTAAERAVLEEAATFVNKPMYSFGINAASTPFWAALDQLRMGTPWSTLAQQVDPKVIQAIDDLWK